MVPDVGLKSNLGELCVDLFYYETREQLTAVVHHVHCASLQGVNSPTLHWLSLMGMALFAGNYGAPAGFWYDPWSQDDPIMVMMLA